MTDAALEITGLSFAYGRKIALDHVDLIIKQGECAILLGPNGAGKSTLFALITRLYDFKQGSVRLAGYDIKKHTGRALAGLGVVFQQTTLDMDLTVMQNLRYHAALHGLGRKMAGMRIQEELERLQMFERRTEKIRQLNGGHRRRVEIARALLHNPKVLLLDEPTVGLDVPSRRSIVDYVHSLSSDHNIAVLWATHLIDEIYPDDQLIIIHQGGIRAKGMVDNVIKQAAAENINDAFFKLTQGAEA